MVQAPVRTETAKEAPENTIKNEPESAPLHPPTIVHVNHRHDPMSRILLAVIALLLLLLLVVEHAHGQSGPASAGVYYYNTSTFKWTAVSATNPLPITGSISATNPCASNTGAAVPAQACLAGLNVAGNQQAWTGVNPTGSVFAAQIDLESLGGVVLGAMANYGTSPGAVKVPGVNAFITNTPAVSQSGTWTVQPGNTANTTPWLTTPTPGATSATALSACNILSTASTNATSCKGSAGNLYGFDVYNTTTTVYYLRLYNTASAPTCSSATGFIRSIPVPPGAASGLVGGIVSNQTYPVNYSTGIGYCITGGSTSTDNTNAAAGVFGEIRYD